MLQIVTTDEETLAQELIRPAFATHVLAEEDEESIYVTDAGTEGEDPDEVIQITSKGKVDIKGWRWIVKVTS